MENGKFKRFIQNSLIDFIVICISAAYVLYQTVDISPTGLEFWQVVAKGILGIIVGILIKQTLGENGFIRGYASDTWKEEKDKYNTSCNDSLKYIDKVDKFYADELEAEKKSYRITHLQGVRLRYEDFFGPDGNYLGTEILPKWKYKDKKAGEGQAILDWKQRRVLNQCISVKVYTLNLFSEYANDTSSYTKKEVTDYNQRAKMLRKNTLTGFLIAALGAYFTVEMIDWNWGKVISAMVQIFGWVTTGVLQLYSNLNYVTIDKVNKLKEKKLKLAKFKKNCEDGIY